MDAMGVNAALKRAGAQEGDDIFIDEFDFEYMSEGKNLLQHWIAQTELETV